MPQSFVTKIFLVWQVLQEMINICRKVLLSTFDIVLSQNFGRKKQRRSRFAWCKWLFKLLLLRNLTVRDIANYFVTCGFKHFVKFLNAIFHSTHSYSFSYVSLIILADFQKKCYGACSRDSLVHHNYSEVQFAAESMAQGFIVFKIWVHNREAMGLVLMGDVETIVLDPKRD